MSHTIKLPPVLDIVAAPGLLESFLQLRGNQLSVEASQVQRLGAQCLQIFLAARTAWAEDNITIQFQNPSEDFVESLELLGTSISKLTYNALRTIGDNCK
ncbi:MAG: STAS domain-containing protein [Rhodospirillales bacterium]|nr:STAS domain-containing protein [Rhodospirillales bacterium]MDE2320068.1 STAS domain-containing protein [Rhodospirillales bacterium]